MDERRTIITTPSDEPAVVSRRRLLSVVGGVVGVSLLGAARPPALASDLGATALSEPGTALAPAVRVPPPTTTTPTAPPTTLVEVPDGSVRFPIVVGENDYCWVANNFGDCRGNGCSRLHEGVDIMADQGLAVIAPVSGRLQKRYEDWGLLYGAGHGWTLVDDKADVHYRFFHLDRHEDGLEVDDEVEEGQIIGYVGNTGTSGADSDTNYHLHFEYRPGNSAVDSYPILHRSEHVTWEN